MTNLKNVIYLSNGDYETLVSTGTVTIDGETLTYDENNVYITPDKLASTAEDGLMSASDKSKLDNIESGAQVNVQSDWNQTDTGADDYIKNKPEVDTDFSLTSTNALQNKVISKKLEYIDYALTHIKYKLFGVTTLSEIDYKVDYATIYPIPETLSDEDGTHRVVYSDTQLKEIEGNSVAFNQSAILTRTNATIRGITFVNNGDETLSISGTSEKEENFVVGNFKLVQGHKYLAKTRFISGSPTDTTYYIKWSTISYGVDVGNGLLFTATSSNDSAYILFSIYASNVSIDCKVSLNIFDLTQMFGTGNEPTTVAEFNRIFPLTYYPYNAGEIKSTVIKGVRVRNSKLATVPLNKIGVVDLGTLTYTKQSSYTASATGLQSLIKKPSAWNVKVNAICSKYGTVAEGSISSIDKSIAVSTGGVFLLNDSAYADYTEQEIKTAMSGLLLYFECIEPQDTIPQTVLDKFATKTIQIPQTELPSAGSVHDTIKIVEGNVVAGQQRYNMVRVSRINSVDLGTFSWGNVNSIGRVTSVATIANIKLPSGANVKANVICSKYATYTADQTYKGIQGISIEINGKISICDSSFVGKTSAEIKSNLSGVMLYYELATLTETTLATDLTFEEISAIIEQGGSIETVFEIVPPNIKTAFVVNKAIVS